MQHKKPLYLLFTANAISGLAQGISMLAIPWYFASSEHSSLFNTMYAVLTLMVLFWGIYAGTLVDRFSRKKNFMAITLICGTLISLISGYGFYNGFLSEWWVIAVFGITMFNYNIHYPTLYAFGQEISEPAYYQKINSNIEIVSQTTSILSGGLAALLLEGSSDGNLFGFKLDLPFSFRKWEIHEIFAIDAFTYFVAALLISYIKYQPKNIEKIETGPVWQRIRTGFNYLKTHPHLWIFGICSYSIFAMLIVEIHAVLPAYVENHLKENGSVFAAADLIYAVGALFAGIGVTMVFKRTNPVKAVIIMIFITSAIFYWTSFAKSVIVLYTVSIILGFTNAGTRILRISYIFTHVPNNIIGRTNSILSMANVLNRSLFIFLFSVTFFHTSNNMKYAYFIMASFLFIAGIVLILNYKKLTRSEG